MARSGRVSARIYQTAFGHCLACGKQCFRSRRHAKRAARTRFPGDRMSAYRCRHPDGQGWHFGHSDRWRWYRDYQDAA